MRRLLPALLLLVLAAPALAQERPLTTQPVETIPPGELLLQLGFEFLQDARFPLSGLEGDLSRIGVLDVHMGVSRAVELQIQGTIRQFLSVSQQNPAFVAPSLSRGGTSTSDFGDITLAAKMHLLRETERRPAIGLRFGFEMPNTNETRGIGGTRPPKCIVLNAKSGRAHCASSVSASRRPRALARGMIVALSCCSPSARLPPLLSTSTLRALPSSAFVISPL